MFPTATRSAGQFVDQPEAALDAFDHQVADIGAVDAASGCHPGQEIASRSQCSPVQRKGSAYFLAVVAPNLEPVRAPPRIGPIDCDPAIVPAFLTVTGMAVEQQTVGLHDAVDPLTLTGAPPCSRR